MDISETLSIYKNHPRREYAPGEVVCSEGEPGDSFFVLAQGHLGVVSGDDIIANITQKGEIIGEMSVLLGMPRTATVKALIPSECYEITKQTLMDDMKHSQDTIVRHLALCQTRRLMDTTRLYRNLQELEHLREGLTHMIVHDLRNPLGYISGFAELLEMTLSDGNPDRTKILEYTGMIRQSTQQMANMIEMLLLTAKMESGEFQPNISSFDFAAVCHKVGQLFKMRALNDNKNLKYAGPESGIVIQADEGLLTRVIENLLGNACKYTHNGDSITLELETLPQGVRFKISDSGIGIPPEYHDKIFEKFAQVQLRKSGKRTGVGLGLAFCKMAVNAHKGQISVQSRLNHGSTFIVEIPSVPASN